MNCQSCGMPMVTDVDHGGARADNVYCQHCTDTTGNLKSREEVREGMITFYMGTMGKTREEAEREVETHMAEMPAWSVGALPSAPAQDVVMPAAELAEVPAEQAPIVEPEPIAPTAPVSPAAEETVDVVANMPVPPVEPPAGVSAAPVTPSAEETQTE